MKIFWIGGLVAVIALLFWPGPSTRRMAPVTAPSTATPQASNTTDSVQLRKPITPSLPVPPLPTYRGYSCTVDCSGHEAGYEWAEENSIDDEDDCSGNSQSFIEGCEAYAEEQQEARQAGAAESDLAADSADD